MARLSAASAPCTRSRAAAATRTAGPAARPAPCRAPSRAELRCRAAFWPLSLVAPTHGVEDAAAAASAAAAAVGSADAPRAADAALRLAAAPGGAADAALRFAAGVLAGVPASVAVDELLDREGARVAALSNAETADGVRMYVAHPPQVLAGEPAPVVLLIHQFFGLSQREVDLCDELARLGCVAVAPDTFQGRSTSWVPRALALVAGAAVGPGASWGATDLASALRWVEAQPWGDGARVGVAGFCYGGGAALRFAEKHPEDVDAVACFYGAPLADAGRLQCPVLAVYGTADTQFPPAVVDKFEKHLAANHVEAEVLSFEGQPHAFVTDLAAIKAGGAPEEAWAAFVAFLRANALLPARPPVLRHW